MIYAAFLKPGPLGRLLGPTLAENREQLKYLILPTAAQTAPAAGSPVGPGEAADGRNPVPAWSRGGLEALVRQRQYLARLSGPLGRITYFSFLSFF